MLNQIKNLDIMHSFTFEKVLLTLTMILEVDKRFEVKEVSCLSFVFSSKREFLFFASCSLGMVELKL